MLLWLRGKVLSGVKWIQILSRWFVLVQHDTFLFAGDFFKEHNRASISQSGVSAAVKAALAAFQGEFIK